MVDNSSTILNGMKQIQQVIGRAEATVLALKRRYPFSMPIRKIEGAGGWTSVREPLVAWWAAYVKGEVDEMERVARAKAMRGGDSPAGQTRPVGDLQTRDTGGQPDFGEMSKKDIRAWAAKELDLELREGDTKEKLLDAIEQRRARLAAAAQDGGDNDPADPPPAG